MTAEIKLTDDEILLLDGKGTPETQRAVEAAKFRKTLGGMSDGKKKIISKILEVAATERKLTYCHTSARYCSGCGKTAGYVKYKSGRNKGTSNWNKPLSFSGIEFNRGFVSVQNHISAGGCNDCVREILPYVKEAVKDMAVELPECLRGPVTYTRFRNRKCLECGWTGHEGELRQLPALFEGRYAGGCPNCPAENRFMGRMVIDFADGHSIIPVPTKGT